MFLKRSDPLRAVLSALLFWVVLQSILELLFIMMHLSFVFATSYGIEG